MKPARLMLAALAFLAGAAHAQAAQMLERYWSQPEVVLLAQRARTCKDVRTCREAVILWCGGYRRADGDGDGIPCENVCRSKREVDAIRDEIGC